MKSLTIQDDVNGGGSDGEFGYAICGADTLPSMLRAILY